MRAVGDMLGVLILALCGCTETGVTLLDTSEDATPSEWDSVSTDTLPRVAWPAFFDRESRLRLLCLVPQNPFLYLWEQSRRDYQFGLVDARGRVIVEFPWRERFADPIGLIAQIDHVGDLEFLFVFSPDHPTQRSIEIFEAGNNVWRQLASWDLSDPTRGLILNSDPNSPIGEGWHEETYAWFDRTQPHLVFLEHRELTSTKHMARSRALTVIDTRDHRRVASFDLRTELSSTPGLDLGRSDHIFRFVGAVGVGDESLFAFRALEWPEDRTPSAPAGHYWRMSGYWSPFRGVVSVSDNLYLAGNILSDGREQSSFMSGPWANTSVEPRLYREHRQDGLSDGIDGTRWVLPSAVQADLPGSMRCARVLSIMDHRNRTYLAGISFSGTGSPSAVALFHRGEEVLRFESVEQGLDRFSASIHIFPTPVRY